MQDSDAEALEDVGLQAQPADPAQAEQEENIALQVMQMLTLPQVR